MLYDDVALSFPNQNHQQDEKRPQRALGDNGEGGQELDQLPVDRENSPNGACTHCG